MPGTSGWRSPVCAGCPPLPVCPSLQDVVFVWLFASVSKTIVKIYINLSLTSILLLTMIITRQFVRRATQKWRQPCGGGTPSNAAVLRCLFPKPPVCQQHRPLLPACFAVGAPSTRACRSFLFAETTGSRLYSRARSRLESRGVERGLDRRNDERHKKRSQKTICARPYSSSAETPCAVALSLLYSSGGALARPKKRPPRNIQQ